jgi:shikimate kinase
VNVVLIGYRGTGKSAVAERLARQLDLEAISLDAELVKAAGKSIPAVVEERGWAGFRDLEEEIVRTFASRDGQVLDCGGGVVERESNFAVLRRSAQVVWLTASVATILERIADDDQRPALTTTKSFTEEVEEVLLRRTPLYRRLAHYEVATDGRDLEAIAAVIARLVGGAVGR